MYLLPFWISLIIKSFPLLLPSHNIASIMFQCSVFKVHLWIPLSRNSMKPQITFLFFVVSVNLLWWRVPGSNRWPPACKAGALPAELTPHRGFIQKWWAKMDSNHRPHDYQSCALASWAIGPYQLHFFLRYIILLYPLNWITLLLWTISYPCTDL